MGFSDARLARLTGLSEAAVRGAPPCARRASGVQAGRHLRGRVRGAHALSLQLLRDRRSATRDSGRMRGLAERPAQGDDPGRRAEPDRPGHRVRLLLRATPPSGSPRPGFETIMVNCNPETVSTDYDTSDRLYFEPLTAEDVLEIVRVEASAGELLRRDRAARRPDAAQARRSRCAAAGVPILGTSPDAIDLAEDRERFQKLLAPAGAAPAGQRHLLATPRRRSAKAERLGFPVVMRPSYVLGGRRCGSSTSASRARALHGEAGKLCPSSARS